MNPVSLTFKVSGHELECSSRFWFALAGPLPELPTDWESDGCSGGAPDAWRTWRGRHYKLWPACFIHDYHYRYGAEEHPDVFPSGAIGRLKADAFLRENLRRMIRFQGGGWIDQKRISWLYWGRVRIWGCTSWQGWNGNLPSSKWARFKDVYGIGD